MRKSLLITLDFPPKKGGISNYLSNLSNNFYQKDIVVLTDSEEKLIAKSPYKIHYKKLISTLKFIWPKWIFLFFIVKKIIKKENIRYIQVGQILPIGTVALMIKKYLGIPYLVYTYGMDLTLPQSSKRKTNLIKSILKNADKIITISQYTKNELLKLGAEEKKITIVYPCASLTQKEIDFEKQSKITAQYNLKDKKILLTVGRLVERKGQDIVIKSLKKVLEKFPNLVYLIIGDGPNKNNLINLTKKLNLQDKVLFLDEVNNSDLRTFYQLCHIFIMPSRQIKQTGDVEGFGIVFLEANLFEKPVIGGKSGGQPDAIEDGYSGLLVNPEDENEIAETIIKLLENPDLAQKLGKQGKKRVLEKFQWKKEAQKIINLLS